MDENGTPQQPGQAPPPPPPQQPPAAPFGDTPAPPPPPAPAAPAAPPPPQPGQATPPPPPQQPTTAAAQPAAPAGKKKPAAIILIIVAVVLALCALTACGIGAFMLLGAADAEGTIEEADAHYDSAIATIDEIDSIYDEALTAIEGGDTSGATALSDDALALVSDARSDVTQSRTLNDSLDASTYRTEYAEALDQLDNCLNSFESLFVLLPQEGELYDTLDTWWADLEAADDQFDRAYTLIDNEEYAEAKSQAEQAQSTYAESAKFFADLDAQFPGLELDKQAEIEQLYTDVAAELVAVADAGMAEDWDAYNEHVEAHDALEEELNAAEWPSWTDDWTLLFSTGGLYDDAVAYYDASVEAWNRSADAYNAGDY